MLIDQLCECAKHASKNAYAPYSQFPLGASILGDDGRIFIGTNVENASFGLTMCAERNAIFRGITDGIKKILVLVLYSPSDKPIFPCGACRQVLSEFSEDAQIISICDSYERIECTIKDLLPSAFKFNQK